MKLPEQLERRAEKFDVHAVHIPRLPRFETRPAWSLPNLTYDHIQRALFEGQILAEQRSVELQARALVLEHKTIGRAVCTSTHLQAARGNAKASHLSDKLRANTAARELRMPAGAPAECPHGPPPSARRLTREDLADVQHLPVAQRFTLQAPHVRRSPSVESRMTVILSRALEEALPQKWRKSRLDFFGT